MSLTEKVAKVTSELGIDMHGNPRMPLPAAVAQAVTMLGLQSDTKGMNLMQQVDACCAVMFGAPAFGMMHAAAAAPAVMATAVTVPLSMANTQPMAVAVAYASPVAAMPVSATAIGPCAGMTWPTVPHTGPYPSYFV